VCGDPDTHSSPELRLIRVLALKSLIQGGQHRTFNDISQFRLPLSMIYYVGLLAGGNDIELLRRTGTGRDINRHSYTARELEQQLKRPVVQSLLALLRLRNGHAAFHGSFHAAAPAADRMTLAWNNGSAFARLEANLTDMDAVITCSREDTGSSGAVMWQSSLEARV
jgi:sucrose phosphorylase